MQIKTGYIHSGKFNLRYTIEGDGQNALVIGSSYYYPRIFSQALRKHLRMVCVDHRIFAEPHDVTDRNEYTLDVILDDMELTRKELNLGKIIVIGHSGHAFMALEYAKKYPENVSHVVMIGIAPNLNAASQEAADRYWQELVCTERKNKLDENSRSLEKKLVGLAPDQQFIQQYVATGPRAWFDFNFDATSLWDDAQMNMPMFGYVWGEIFRDIDIIKELDKLDKPVFIGLGLYDFVVAPFYSWHPIRHHFKNLTVRIFEKSGHTPPYEEPEKFDAELLHWLKSYSCN
jgi:proline iminopeptidase